MLVWGPVEALKKKICHRPWGKQHVTSFHTVSGLATKRTPQMLPCDCTPQCQAVVSSGDSAFTDEVSSYWNSESKHEPGVFLLYFFIEW